MTEAAAAHPPISGTFTGSPPPDGPGPVVVDGEALLPGPRGGIGVTVSVRLLETTEIWLYAAEMVRDRPARGLWRWRRDAWEQLSGGTDIDPRWLARALMDARHWINPQAATQRDAVVALMRTVLSA